MLHELFRLQLFGHQIPVYGYGFMLVVAFLACVQSAQWLARRMGIDPELVVNAVLIALVCGIIGARACSVLENFRQYTQSPSIWANLANVINIREGGLTFYGGFLLATPCCIAYAWYHKIPVRRGMDLVAPVLMIGLGFGRIGCFLNGCCYGEQCDLPWGVRFPYYSYAYLEQFDQGKLMPPPPLLAQTPQRTLTPLPPQSPVVQADPQLRALADQARALPVQPTQLYSAFTGFLLAALLIAYIGLPHLDGRVFALMLILEGFSRYVLEMIRVEPSVLDIKLGGQIFGFSISMILGMLSVVAGLLMWTMIGLFSPPARHKKSPADRSDPPDVEWRVEIVRKLIEPADS
jgi:phosphatidylglycerol:prolipoprotein diacylglycerol transferase